MEFNDNANLYSDPNAYIQNWGYETNPPEQKIGQANNQPPPKFFRQNIYPADNLCLPNFNNQQPNNLVHFQPNCNPNNSPNCEYPTQHNGNSNFYYKPNNPPNCRPPQHKQNCNNGQYNCQKPPQKVVFSEPYESVPNFYLNNNFKKGNCDCIPKPKPKCPPPKPPFSFDLKNILPLLSGLFKGGSGAGGIGNILSILNQNSSGEQGGVQSGGWQSGGAQGSGWQSGGTQGGSLDFSSILKTLSNTGGLDGILNLFKPKTKNEKTKSGLSKTNSSNSNFFKNNNSNLSENDTNKSSDFVIKNYSRVE